MEIIAYTSTGCFYCDKLKELFERAQLPYTAVTVRKDITIQEFTKQFPLVDTYPHVIIDGEEIGGLTQTAKFLLDKGLVSPKK
jgi:glutaredoxin